MKKLIAKTIITSFECGIIFMVGINFSFIKQENYLQIFIGSIAILLSIYVLYKTYIDIIKKISNF
ncbi:hypothetical protein NSB31_29240 [Bacillus cereus]|uniref:hypothetical protein n=1 Tax=Bacillota TaxID=1239 RepID=UPI002149EE81|nr:MULTISPECIES: hypothetical protein [Bacillota]MCR1952732.1 hypothetical protein [Clostridium sp. DSM 100503]MCR2013748.1 hypothetical protein [Bacillus cereus]